MTKFNPKNKELLSASECLDPAMEIVDKNDAMQYLKDYEKYIQNIWDNYKKQSGISDTHSKTALEVAKDNIGYCSGRYSEKIRERDKGVRVIHRMNFFHQKTFPLKKRHKL